MVLNIPVIEVDAKKVRSFIPITLSKDTIDEKIDLFYKDKNTLENPIPGSIIVDISKITLINNEITYYGIIIMTINIKKILNDYNKRIEDEFYLHLIDNDGKNADECIISDRKLPYLFKYSNKDLKIFKDKFD